MDLQKDIEKLKKYKNVLLTCGWCGYQFTANLFMNKDGERNKVICPHCSQILSSSHKESTGNVVGRKHTHIEYKNGDIAI